MADQTLVMMLNDVRGKTLRLLEGVQEAEARFTPPGLQNSILWHAGHVVVVNEHLGVMHASGRPAACPAGWVEMFGWQSKPATVTQWPTLAEVVAQLKEQLGRFGPALEAMQPEQLERALQHGTVRHSILHGLHDEACHQGEIWLLKKLWKARGA